MLGYKQRGTVNRDYWCFVNLVPWCIFRQWPT